MHHSKRLSYAERVAAKATKRQHPTAQALAARRRVAVRNHNAAILRADTLTTNATAGDCLAAHLLATN